MASSQRLAVPELATVEFKSGMTRQAFMLKGALTAGAVYGAAAVTPFVRSAIAQEGGGDVEILNFALTLEFLEGEFYVQGVDVDGLSEEEVELAEKLRDDELEHVDALKATIEQLGGTPVEEPEFDFTSAVESREAFLKTAVTLEDTGVSAYNGAAPDIESVEVLAAAGSIVQIEARHAALIRLVRGNPPAPQAFDVASPMDEVVEAITPFIVA
jgi:rubrerythrin